MAAETSLLAYRKLEASGALSATRGLILSKAKSGRGFTLEGMAKRLKTAPHKISGRITELNNCGAIQCVGHSKNSDKNTVRVYQITDEAKQALKKK